MKQSVNSIHLDLNWSATNNQSLNLSKVSLCSRRSQRILNKTLSEEEIFYFDDWFIKQNY